MSKQKNALIAAADDLAAKSRIIRRVATGPDAIVSKLVGIGLEHSKEIAARKEARAAEAVASIRPLIEKARAQLADADAARDEAKTFVAKFTNVNWDVLRDRFPRDHGIAEQVSDPNRDPYAPVISTRDRIAQLRAAVEELGSLAGAGDEDLRRFLSSASDLKEIESRDAQYAINGLMQRAALSADAGQSIRNRIAGIERHLQVLGAVLVAEVSNDAPMAQEEVK
jgi:hypothetical protein